MVVISGSCHCKNIEYIFETLIPVEDLYYRECNCSYCKKQGAIYTSDPEGVIYINIKEERNIIKYKFSSEVVEFVICKQCGIMPCASLCLNKDIYAVINVRTSDIDLNGKNIKNVILEAEAPNESKIRRLQNWSTLKMFHERVTEETR